MISIVMAYYNRQRLLDKTIDSIKCTADTDYEIVLVDDGSDTPVVCSDARIIRIKKRDKWWTNPCVPYNIGFREAKGDIVIIQNPECYHVGDIISYVRSNIKPNTYLSFGCYAINREETANFHNGVFPHIGEYVFASNSRDKKDFNGWYNHSKHRDVAYHFCSAIMKDNLKDIGGFDERYAHGISYEDDDFIRRIRRRQMDVKIIDSPYVIHQYHTLMAYAYRNMRQLHTRNKQIYNGR